jgi:hypothetical protein
MLFANIYISALKDVLQENTRAEELHLALIVVTDFIDAISIKIIIFKCCVDERL